MAGLFTIRQFRAFSGKKVLSELQNLPERVTLRCRVCAEGRIVITRPMLEEMLGADHA